MTKARKKPTLKQEVKELFIAEEQVLFEFFDWGIKKRHFYSIASIIFTLSLGLFFLKNLKNNQRELSWLFVIILLLISIAIVSIIVKNRIKRYDQPTLFEILKRVIPLYTIALIFVVAYLILDLLFTGSLLSIKEIIFLLSFATVFETITFNIH